MTSIMIRQKVLFLSIIFYVVAAVPLEEIVVNPNAVEDLNYRLNDEVLPSHYNIKLTPYFENEGNKSAFSFDGEVEITLKATKPNVNSITLHFYNLTIISYSFNRGAIKYDYNASHYNEKYNKWTIPIPIAVNSGILNNLLDTTLQIKYIGYMQDDMYGFYRSYYYENGKKIWLGLTQFQPDHARRAFPCFDEPGYKAQFDLTIVRPIDVARSISNTKIKEIQCDASTCHDIFKTTPKMSTYLLAFIVSNFKGRFGDSDKFGVYARPEAEAHTVYAVDVGMKILKSLNEYFDIDYYSVDKVEKMDMAAIPDFSAGAMENWGLLTYRETLVLYDPDSTPLLNQQRIAAVITHEQLHQWFGDLVTCSWWSHTWMNEAFARYFQFMGTAWIYEDWQLEEQFTIENLQQSMQLDSTEKTHPMTTIVNTKQESQKIFDNISYNKGASILRWLSYFIGKDVFQEILRFHIKSHQHESVVPSDFFFAIANKSTEEASVFFESWTNQSGFPLITSSLDENGKLKLTQKRFMNENGINNDKTEIYNVPISIALNANDFKAPKHDFYLKKSSDEFEVKGNRTNDFYMLNVQQTGFYRVHYSDDNWQKISVALSKEDFADKIHVLNRAQVVDDLFHLARVGIVKYSQAVSIVSFLKKEKNYIPWLAALNQGLLFLSQRLDEKDFKIFSWYINDLMADIYKHLTFESRNEDVRTDVYNRVNILTWLCKYGHEECVEKSKKAFEDYTVSFKKVPKDLRSVIYCNAIRYGGDEEFNFLFNRLMIENFAQEQLNIMGALGCSKNETNIKRVLGRLIRTEDIRPQDRNTVISSVLNSNIEGQHFLYNFITNNYNDWQKALGNLDTLSTVVERFTEQSQLEKFEAFLEQEKLRLGEFHTSLTRSVDTAKTNLAWNEKYMKEFIGHLHELNSASIKLISISLAAISFLCLHIFN